MDLLLQNVPEEMAHQLLNKKFAEVALRDEKQRFTLLEKLLVKIPEENQGGSEMLGALSKLNVAMQAANLAATIVGTVIICGKLDRINHKLSELQKATEDLKDFNFEMQIAFPCRKLTGDYKLFADSLRKEKPVSGEELVELIRECQNYLVSLHNLSGKIPIDMALDLIFTLLPILANCIMIYYQQRYDEVQGKHALHDDWMSVFELLNSEEYLNQIQDDLFLTQRKTNRQVNEYLAYHKVVVNTYRQKIEQLLADLEECGGEDGYSAAMQWSRQYVTQQAKAKQAELESQYGSEKAQMIMEQALEFATA